MRMYVCGPTVYADAHIGHAMSGNCLRYDTPVPGVHRARGNVRHELSPMSMDKIIVRAQETGQDPPLSWHSTIRTSI